MSIQWETEKCNVTHVCSEYYSATLRNKLLLHVTSWMNLKHITLSKRKNMTQRQLPVLSQGQKASVCQRLGARG